MKIYIPSKGRPKMKTAKPLRESGLEFTVVIDKFLTFQPEFSKEVYKGRTRIRCNRAWSKFKQILL